MWQRDCCLRIKIYSFWMRAPKTEDMKLRAFDLGRVAVASHPRGVGVSRITNLMVADS